MPQKVVLLDYQEFTLKGVSQIINEKGGFELLLKTTDPQKVLKFLPYQAAALALIDVNHPGLSSLDYVSELLGNQHDLKILGMGNNLSEDTMKAFLKAGGHGLILKDANANELLKGMQDLLTNSFYFYDGISVNWVNNVKKKFGQNVPYSSLKSKEIEIMKLICQEKTSKEIGDELFLSNRTVENHINKIKQKLNCKNIVGIAKYAFEKNIF
jgi:DNA-binding NarL/FixJ family response regulator